MNGPCAGWSDDLAALAMDALETDARVAVVAHVDGCAACAEALAGLRSTVAVLGHADPDRLGALALAPRGLDARVVGAVEQERALARRRTRVARWGVAAAAATLVLAGTGALVLSRAPEPGVIGEVVTLVAPPGQAPPPEVTATVAPKAWGTAVGLVVSGSTPGVVYRVWVAHADGERTSAGTFMGADRTLTVAAAAGVARKEATAIGLSTEDRDPLVVAELAPPPNA